MSQKIRHIRFNQRNKSQMNENNPTPQKRMFKPASLGPQLASEPVSSDSKVHTSELQKEWHSKQPLARNSNHIKLLIKQTREYRVQQLKNHPNGRIRPVIDEFPCFEDGQYVSITRANFNALNWFHVYGHSIFRLFFSLIVTTYLCNLKSDPMIAGRLNPHGF